ncbi:CGNR zinc finger domain-containing protein [Nocardia sp. NPDC058058]|uniref:CGNR zinc finger domain-containing protein n=1 Tax=Nocardia sp. NPDC058058 TaxID=3346317 RepID=UPI0036DB65AF
MEMVLTGHDGHSFGFDAGALSLEFLLTGSLEPWESLHSPEDLAAWIPQARLGIASPVAVTETELRTAKQLRAAIHRLAVQAAGDTAKQNGPGISEPAQSALGPVATLNAVAAAPPLVPLLGEDLHHGWATPVHCTQFLSTVARDAIDLFSGPQADRIRMCGGDRCYLMFLDTSRPGARRWCSMDRCGNRHKMRARRART